MLRIIIFRLEGSKFQKKCLDRIGTGTYSIETTEKRPIFNLKIYQKKAKNLILMCIFFNNVAGAYSIETPWNLGFWALISALLRGSAGDWPEMGQKGPKHYKSRHSCHCLGSEITLGCLFRVVGCLFYRGTLYVYESFRYNVALCFYEISHKGTGFYSIWGFKEGHHGA